MDRVAAGHIENAGNIVSGLDLSEIGKDGHAVANLLWQIAAYLRRRDEQTDITPVTPIPVTGKED